ncbi:septal ring lytic transglycosylase RlpA family protein [Pontibacter mangrovi]|uniref:Probable endolytic peptidoglycan transglycosylase RlpA n=1 Tax=Pontibacter mangrovi TaxID=2589816 RepID=A0A501VZQ0_9BACT|nr:septal ring lytic transglycosylase RlpA family protein [Pontibacter mangrovi]TPE43203.1 septal ring lytic transglycosylase RlpA family protein [Pontibacter mangrovi]
MNVFSIVLFFLLSLASGTAPYTANGKASYYADRFQGSKTASGERYDKAQLTAAHPSLPFGTKVLVENLKNGKTVVVRVNDRMANRHRLIDLSKAAAKAIGMVQAGTATVSITEVADEPQQDTPFAVSEADSTPKQ